MNRLFVIGDPVRHSLSPVIQNAMLRGLGLESEWVYAAQRVGRAETAAWLETCRREGVRGFNATMPHKENLVNLVDVLSPEAVASRSVNTVVLRDGKTYGFSTDGAGFVASVRDAGLSPVSGPVLLLGAGGAAKAVALALLDAGAERITVCARTPERGAELCRLAPERMTAAGFDRADLEREVSRCTLLVNCTPMGMSGTAARFESLDFLDALPAGSRVCDLIYSPAETELLARARALGHTGVNGLGMLIHQAIFALEHFLDRELDHQEMRLRAEQALSEEKTVGGEQQ